MTDTPKKGWFQRLSAGLARSSQQMTETVVGAFVREPLSEAALDRLPNLRLDPEKPSRILGLAFRSPESLHVKFDPA